MRGIKTFIVSAFMAATLAGSDYFPLQVGNSWAYQITQGRVSRPGTINVEAIESVEGQSYFRVSFFEQSLLLRQQQDGSILLYDRDSKTENVWLPFGLKEGSVTSTVMDQCSRMVTIASVAAKVTSILGAFDNALHLRYTPNCADAGVTQQYFLPYVGMLLHETTSIAGPVRYELVYSRTGSTNVVAKTNAFTLSTDSPVYKAGQEAEMLARVTLRVTSPIRLTFPSGQNSDMRILNERGESVYFWSADKVFLQIFREMQMEGERNFVMSVPVGNLPPGRYTAEGWLATQPKLYSATVTFEVVP